MTFTGKAMYKRPPRDKDVPDGEDVSDLVGIISPYETPLLDVFGDPMREATSTHHEWLEDKLLPNKDKIVSIVTVGQQNKGLIVEHEKRFRVGDQLQIEGSTELMYLESIEPEIIGNGERFGRDAILVVQRGYGETKPQQIEVGKTINILGNTVIRNNRFAVQNRCSNYTQIFTATVEVSGTDMATRQLSLSDEMDYQKQEWLRKLLRDLENSIINNPQGDKKMWGIISALKTNIFDAEGKSLTVEILNKMLRQIWENNNGNIDLIVVGGYQKRKVNFTLLTFAESSINVYESDFGICRIVTTRWMPQDAVLLLDSSRVKVLPLAGRSFHFKPLASSGDYEYGELIGEYTLELKNEAAHGLIHNLSIS